MTLYTTLVTFCHSVDILSPSSDILEHSGHVSSYACYILSQRSDILYDILSHSSDPFNQFRALLSHIDDIGNSKPTC